MGLRYASMLSIAYCFAIERIGIIDLPKEVDSIRGYKTSHGLKSVRLVSADVLYFKASSMRASG